MKKKTLIVTPDIKLLGGVANHYLGLKYYWKKDVEYIYYGKRHGLLIPAALLFPFDLLNFLRKIVSQKQCVVIVNPSLRKYQLFRDGLYLIIAKMFKIEVVTFFHGWDSTFADKIEKKSFLFNRIYNSSSFIYVLYSEYKKKLIKIGITSPILLTTTKVNDSLIKSVHIEKRDGHIKNILFLSRIEKYKGIYEALETFELLQKKYQHLQLTIVGEGTELKNVRTYIKKKRLKNVSIRGALFGQELINTFKSSDLYIFPSYSEGMPTSVLEAMAFGLPVITSSVGGLNDFFEDGKMGARIQDLNPLSYQIAIEKLIKSKKKCKEIGSYNYKYAIENFLASQVVEKMEADIDFYTSKI